mgnify:CR=1 FL=1
MEAKFEWDKVKDTENQKKHGISFEEAKCAFFDEFRVIAEDLGHSSDEERYFCFGKVGEGVLTVRFTFRDMKIRIFGAGYWRKGRKVYEKEN